MSELRSMPEWADGSTPAEPGIYAIVVCWDPCEGMFPDVGTWDGERWTRAAGPVSCYRGPFDVELDARAWADAHDPEG